MAVEQVIERLARLKLAKQAAVVAVYESDLFAVDFDDAVGFVHRHAGAGGGLAQMNAVVVVVAEDEMGGQPAEQVVGFGDFDVAAVQHRGDAAGLDQAEGSFRGGVASVGVAQNGDEHGTTSTGARRGSAGQWTVPRSPRIAAARLASATVSNAA